MTAAQLSREAVAINQIQMAHNATNHGSSCLTEYRRIRRTANSPAEFRKILEQIHLAESALCSARENIEMALPVIEQQAVDLEDADICKMDTGEGPCNEQTDHGVEFVGHQYIAALFATGI